MQNEYQIANNSGRLCLDRYGIHNNIFENNGENYYKINGSNDFLVLFYFQSYVALKAENLILHYLVTNSGYDTDIDVNNSSNEKLEVHFIPDNIPPLEKIQNDRLQYYLRDIALRQYKDQQKNVK
jgi:hypothetical protein